MPGHGDGGDDAADRAGEERLLAVDAGELGALLRQLDRVSDRVAEVADDLNLLAINADLASARAGFHAEGFSEVGVEISRRADDAVAVAEEVDAILERAGVEPVETPRSRRRDAFPAAGAVDTLEGGADDRYAAEDPPATDESATEDVQAAVAAGTAFASDEADAVDDESVENEGTSGDADPAAEADGSTAGAGGPSSAGDPGDVDPTTDDPTSAESATADGGRRPGGGRAELPDIAPDRGSGRTSGTSPGSTGSDDGESTSPGSEGDATDETAPEGTRPSTGAEADDASPKSLDELTDGDGIDGAAVEEWLRAQLPDDDHSFDAEIEAVFEAADRGDADEDGE